MLYTYIPLRHMKWVNTEDLVYAIIHISLRSLQNAGRLWLMLWCSYALLLIAVELN